MSKSVTSFETQAKQARTSLVWDMLVFLSHTKKWWLLPILICLAVLSLLALFAGSGAAPFIYTLF